MPATIDRGVGSPRSTERWSNFLAFGTAVALITVPTRSSILLNSSILIGASGAERGSASAGDEPGALVGAGAEAGAAVGACAGAVDAGAARSGGTILSRIACCSLSSSRGNNGDGGLAFKVVRASGRARPPTRPGPGIPAAPPAVPVRIARAGAGQTRPLRRRDTPRPPFR